MKYKAISQYNKGNKYISKSDKNFYYNLVIQTQSRNLDSIGKEIKLMVS